MKNLKDGVIYAQERLVLESQELIAKAIDTSRLDIGTILANIGKKESFLKQVLGNGKDLTIKSLASILWAAGFKMEMKIVRRKEQG